MNFLRTVFALCTGFASYRPYRDLPVTTSLKHLLKLVGLLALVLAICSVPLALRGIDRVARRFDDHRPDFAIQDGKIVTHAAQPATWGDNTLRFILDTTNSAPVPDPRATYGVAFTADSFLYWMTPPSDSGAGTATNVVPRSAPLYSLRGFPDGTVDGDYLRRLFHAGLWLLVPLGWVALVAAGLLCCLLQAYFFSLVAAILERSMPSPLKLQQLLNIAIHAATPPAIVVTIYLVMQLHGINLWLVYLIVYGIFLVGASNACRDPLHRPEPPPMSDDFI
ncbi:MAG TPA: DUF1189 family protein [Verrucomicrobiae bacterium]|nr:DUF1189 family protein [Verrucomicrobiae bacterium]